MRRFHIRSLVVGIILGAAASAAFFIFFGDTIRGGVASTAQDLGKSVKQAGETLEKTGKKMR